MGSAAVVHFGKGRIQVSVQRFQHGNGAFYVLASDYDAAIADGDLRYENGQRNERLINHDRIRALEAAARQVIDERYDSDGEYLSAAITRLERLLESQTETPVRAHSKSEYKRLTALGVECVVTEKETKSYIDSDFKRPTSFSGWIQGPCENCGKLSTEHPQPMMECPTAETPAQFCMGCSSKWPVHEGGDGLKYHDGPSGYRHVCSAPETACGENELAMEKP